MKKIKKILITSIPSIAATAAIVPPLCALSNKAVVNKTIATTNDKAIVNNKTNTAVANSAVSNAYQYVTFSAGTTYAGKCTITGATKVRIENGMPLGSVAKPKILHNEGWKFKGWTLDGTEKVSDNLKVTSDLTLTPLFEQPVDITNCMGISAIEQTVVTFHMQATNMPDLQYSLDYGKNWIQVTSDGQTYTMPKGTTIYLKGLNDGTHKTKTFKGFSTGTDNYTHFSFSNNVNIFGNVLSLIYNGTTVSKTESAIPNTYCFYHLFEGCTTIMNISDNFLFVEGDASHTNLLTEHCFDGMFTGCTGISRAPRLFATNENIAQASGCFKEIYKGCSQVNYVRLRFTGKFEDYSTCWTDWLSGVAAKGTVLYDSSETYTPSASTIPENWTTTESPDKVEVTTTSLTNFTSGHEYQLTASVTKNGTPVTEQGVYWISADPNTLAIDHATGVMKGNVTGSEPKSVYVKVFAKANLNVDTTIQVTINPINLDTCTKVTAVTDSKFSWTYVGQPIIKTTPGQQGFEEILPSFDYSTDEGATWHTLAKDTELTIKAGNHIYLKGDNELGLAKGDDETSYTNFKTSEGSITIGGDIKSLIYDGRGSSEITSPVIPCNYCFQSLFYKNTGLKSVDSGFLSFTNFNSKTNVYASMFEECSNLEDAPALPATTLTEYCYFRMFFNCSALEATPALPAGGTEGTLAHSCYKRMFYGCSTITATPALPATEAKDYCYYMMFQNCTSLSSIGQISLTNPTTYSCFQMFAFMTQSFYSRVTTSSSGGTLICHFTSVGTEGTTRMFSYEDTQTHSKAPKADEYWYLSK